MTSSFSLKIKDDYENWSVEELIAECKKRGIL